MPVTNVEKDLDALTMTITADFPVPVERLWRAYVDPRQIERFWGPTTYPATFVRHDVRVGGESHYVMHGPDGDVSAGYWHFLAVDEGRSFTVRDGFATDEGGTPNAEMPDMQMDFVFSSTDEGSRVVMTTLFGSLEELENLISLGMEEGTLSAMSQIDDVLADLAAFAAGEAELKVLSDTQVRVSRLIRGDIEQVWRAHNDADLVRRWMLGPDGWTMPVCELAAEVGDTYRYEWEQEGGEGRFGFTGELLEVSPPRRSVTTEAMIGMEGSSTTNEMTLTPVEGGTLLITVITYPSLELRDTVLATGMVDGMEAGYARLEREILV